MGFSVYYKYYKQAIKMQGEHNSDPYDKHEEFTDVIYVGDPYEEIGLEVLAGKIMALMARRNVLVFDIKIYELVKKELAFKEQEDGITIKNRKFKFSDGPAIAGKEEKTPEEQLKELLAANPELMKLVAAPVNVSAPVVAAQPEAPKQERPLRMEYFLPDDKVWVEMEQDRLKIRNLNSIFTLKNKYPIYEEKKIGGDTLQGMLYRTKDNGGITRWVRDKLFNPVMVSGDLDGSKPDGGLTDGGLKWDGVVDSGVPSLR